MTVSQLVLLGNLVADPDVTELSDGRRLTRLRVAANSRLQDPSTGRWKDGDTTFLTVVAWRALADSARSLRKGERILVVGQLRQYDYARQDRRNTGYEVQAEHIARPLDAVSFAADLTASNGTGSHPTKAVQGASSPSPLAGDSGRNGRGDTAGDGLG